jgi:hypothetical protein
VGQAGHTMLELHAAVSARYDPRQTWSPEGGTQGEEQKACE